MQRLFCGTILFTDHNEKSAYYCIASNQEDAIKEVDKFQKRLKFTSERIEVAELPTIINGFELSIEAFEEPKSHFEEMLLLANDTKERLFSIIVKRNNIEYVHHVVAADSQDAFKKTRTDFKDENLYDMQASIVHFLGDYKVKLKKVS